MQGKSLYFWERKDALCLWITQVHEWTRRETNIWWWSWWWWSQIYRPFYTTVTDSYHVLTDKRHFCVCVCMRNRRGLQKYWHVGEKTDRKNELRERERERKKEKDKYYQKKQKVNYSKKEWKKRKKLKIKKKKKSKHWIKREEGKIIMTVCREVTTRRLMHWGQSF